MIHSLNNSEMTRSQSKQEDDRRNQERMDRVTTAHGGQVVESIAPEDLESFNDADCKHEKLIRDDSETDFAAFMCANPLCNEIMLYDKDN